MTLVELKTYLSTQTELDVYYFEAPDDASLPYLVYKDAQANTVAADNEVKAVKTTIQLELWAKHKDLEVEAKVETALKPFPWSKTLDYDYDEMIFETIYDFIIMN